MRMHVPIDLSQSKLPQPTNTLEFPKTFPSQAKTIPPAIEKLLPYRRRPAVFRARTTHPYSRVPKAEPPSPAKLPWKTDETQKTTGRSYGKAFQRCAHCQCSRGRVCEFCFRPAVESSFTAALNVYKRERHESADERETVDLGYNAGLETSAEECSSNCTHSGWLHRIRTAFDLVHSFEGDKGRSRPPWYVRKE